VVRRLEAARSLGTVVLTRRPSRIRRSLTRQFARRSSSLAATDRATYLNEGRADRLRHRHGLDGREPAIARDAVRGHGALTLVYSTREDMIGEAIEVAEDAGVALSINLTGSVFVNQSAAFSDYHGTGANPAANATPPTRPTSRAGSTSCNIGGTSDGSGKLWPETILFDNANGIARVTLNGRTG
jgi:hypothetical protein